MARVKSRAGDRIKVQFLLRGKIKFSLTFSFARLLSITMRIYIYYAASLIYSRRNVLAHSFREVHLVLSPKLPTQNFQHEKRNVRLYILTCSTKK